MGSDLRYAYLKDADMVGADRREANIRRSRLLGSDLTGADLVTAEFDATTGLYYAIFCKTMMPWGQDSSG